MRFLYFLLPLLVVGVLAAPLGVEAATANFFGPIINEECQCPGSAPDWGCVLQTFQNVINLGVSLAVIFFVILCAYAGVLLMANPTNPGNRTKAKNMLGALVVGLLIALSAWIMVDFVMKAVYNEGSFGPWNSILDENSARTCIQEQAPPEGPIDTGVEGGFQNGSRVECNRGEQGTYYPGTVNGISEDEDGTNPRVSISYDDGEREDLIPASRCRLLAASGVELGEGDMAHSCTGTATSGPGDGTPKENLFCENCRALSSDVTVKSGASRNLSSGTATKVEGINFQGWQVTEGFPPTFCGHGNSCHYTGTCVDAGFVDRDYSSVERIVSFMRAAEAAGLRAYFETDSCSLRNRVRAAGMSRAYCSGDAGYGHITGNHFSLYGP